VARDYAQLASAIPGLAVAVNLSAHDLQDSELPWFIMETLKSNDLPPEKLVVEITEQAMVKDFANAKVILTRMQDLGICVSLDDFGTGYASLAQLRSLPADELKIDRGFIERIPGDLADEAIVETAIELAHRLGMEVVAEGVSNGAAFRWLQAHGVDRAQGYYWSEPLAIEEIAQWIENYTGGSTRSFRRDELELEPVC
jgi:EAL domain-containing protein (putative c-di-GMP-specific phosphodiesterase class I)